MYMENGNFIWIVQSISPRDYEEDCTEMLMAFPTQAQANAYIDMLKSEMTEQGGFLFNSDGDCYGVDFGLAICCVEFSPDFPCN
jgi:hypothetical protein